MNKELLGKIIDSLSHMIKWADDGSLDRRDESFSYFFGKVDEARALLEELEKLYEEE